MGSTITCFTAASSDEDSKQRFFHQIAPDVKESLQQFLKEHADDLFPIHKHFFEGSGAARFVTATGTSSGQFICMSVINVARADADKIFGELTGEAWTTIPAFQDVVERVLGQSVNPDQPIGSYVAKWQGP